MKRHKTTAPPPGAMLEMRNPRLYGSREEQISARALACRGVPDTRRFGEDPSTGIRWETVPERRPCPRTAAADTPAAHARRVAKLQGAMVECQAVVRDRKARGLDYSEAVTAARTARAEWLAATGADDALRRTVDVACHSDRWG